MALKAANFATATDLQIIMMVLTMNALTGAMNGTTTSPPVDLTPFQLDVLRPLLVVELYRRGLAMVLQINAMP